MKIYTRTGDRGETGLFGGARVSKASARVATYGDVDELNSVLGVARATRLDPKLDAALERVQNELFVLGAELATVPDKLDKLTLPTLDDEAVAWLEQLIDELDASLEPLKTFILPGGGPGAAALHLARTVARRGERALVQLAADEPVRDVLVRYVNRLSDALFTMARYQNSVDRVVDVPWHPR